MDCFASLAMTRCPKTLMAGTCPAIASENLAAHSGVRFFHRLVLEDVETGIDHLAAQQRERGVTIKHEVVEGVGDDFGHPDEARLDIVDEEQVHGAEQQTAEAHQQPDLGDLTDEITSG